MIEYVWLLFKKTLVLPHWKVKVLSLLEWSPEWFLLCLKEDIYEGRVWQRFWGPGVCDALSSPSVGTKRSSLRARRCWIHPHRSPRRVSPPRGSQLPPKGAKLSRKPCSPWGGPRATLPTATGFPRAAPRLSPSGGSRTPPPACRSCSCTWRRVGPLSGVGKPFAWGLACAGHRSPDGRPADRGAWEKNGDARAVTPRLPHSAWEIPSGGRLRPRLTRRFPCGLERGAPRLGLRSWCLAPLV